MAHICSLPGVCLAKCYDYLSENEVFISQATSRKFLTSLGEKRRKIVTERTQGHLPEVIQLLKENNRRLESLPEIVPIETSFDSFDEDYSVDWIGPASRNADLRRLSVVRFKKEESVGLGFQFPTSIWGEKRYMILTLFKSGKGDRQWQCAYQVFRSPRGGTSEYAEYDFYISRSSRSLMGRISRLNDTPDIILLDRILKGKNPFTDPLACCCLNLWNHPLSIKIFLVAIAALAHISLDI
jgi:hypothetical protein